MPKPISVSSRTTWISAVVFSRAGQLALVSLFALLALPRVTPPSWLLSSSEPTDQYAATPFCSPDGHCGEAPDEPSPRTVFSAKSNEQYNNWWKFHAALNHSATEFVSKRRGTSSATASASTTLPQLILLGDSITESYLGSEMGRPSEKYSQVPHVLKEVYGARYDPLVLGVSGDQTQHLLWRLQHGELLPGYSADPDAVFVMLIGTNNLGSGQLPGSAAKGVLAVIEYVLEHTAGRLVVLEVLPRGDGHRLDRLCPPRCNSQGKPFVSFMPAIRKVNVALRQAEPALSERHPGRISLVDCGQVFLRGRPAEGSQETDASEVATELMPDSLHPNAEGHRRMAKCVLDCIGGKC